MDAPLLPTSLSSSLVTSSNNDTDTSTCEVRRRNRGGIPPDDLPSSSSSSSPPQQQAQARILDRNDGSWGIERHFSYSSSNSSFCGVVKQRIRKICCCFKFYRICGKDWFFWLAYKKTFILFLLLFISYFAIICFFGFIYLGLSILGSKAAVNPDNGSKSTIVFCDLDLHDHMEAMYFSLSTMTTIGYGVSDYYFGGCYSPMLIILWQICTAIVFDAVAVGLIFHRIARGASRSRSILFSDKAIVRYIRGTPHLMFRLGERRKYHLIEATVRCYCIRHERIKHNPPPHRCTNDDDRNNNGITQYQTGDDNTNNSSSSHVETTHFVSRQMGLLQPNDRFGSHVWMGLPQVVVHRIDTNSPLNERDWLDAEGNRHRYSPMNNLSDIGNDSSMITSTVNDDISNIQNFLYDRDVEMVVLVEGTDEITGAVTQARHSYKLCDIAFNHTFTDCVHPYHRSRQRNIGSSSLDPAVTIDFTKFHDIVPLPVDEIDCSSCAYVIQNENFP